MIQTPSNGPNSLLDGSRRQTTEVAILDLLARRENTDLRFIEAQRLFSTSQFKKAYDCSKKIIDEDSYYLAVIPLFCAILVEMNKKGDLYHVAHKLVSADPDSTFSWYAVVSSLNAFNHLGVPLLFKQKV